jgi:hypothetical protein
MTLNLGKRAIAEAIKESMESVAIAKKVDFGEAESGKHYCFSERDDGANTHQLMTAEIILNDDFSKTVINIVPQKMTLKQIKDFAHNFFKINGDCTINVS